MFNKQWNVLVVDDEPDVHAVTKLALKRMSVFGLPLVLFECKSKQEAMDFLRTNPEARFLPLAIVDVVMENDTAGLDFCDFMRHELKNPLTRIILRTGQAGKAPEKDVVDKYDITGYLAKTEATQDRIYSTVKCCIKEFYTSFMLMRGSVNAAALGAGIESRESLKKTLTNLLKAVYTDGQGRRVASMQPNYGCVYGDDWVGTGIFEDKTLTLQTRDRLLALPGEPIGREGDRIIFAEGPAEAGTFMVSLAPRLGGKVPAFEGLFTPTAWPMPAFAVKALHGVFLGIRPYWMLADR